MKTLIVTAILATALAGVPAAFAQQNDHNHGSTPSPAQQSQPQAPASGGMMGQMMQQMPEQCRAAMQNMPQSCAGMMQKMMSGMGHSAPTSAADGAQLPHVRENIAAMDKMHGPMMDAAKAPDADQAFVRGMIPHHQGAIDMAQIVLKYGKDDQAKKWANDVIREQTREIKEMQEWLQKRSK